MADRPRVFDNNRGAVLVTWNGRQIRGYSYQSDEQRRLKIRLAHEFVEGWIDGDESAFGNCGRLGEAGIMCRQIGDRDEAVARPTSAIPVQRQLFRQPLLQGREHPLRAAPTFG